METQTSKPKWQKGFPAGRQAVHAFIIYHSHTVLYLGFTEGLLAGQLGATVVFEGG